MRKLACFWWWCLRDAVKGSCAFANDWQWFVGFPAAAVVVWVLNRWLGEGTVNIFSQDTTIGAFEAAGIAFVLTWLLAVLRGLVTAPARFFTLNNLGLMRSLLGLPQ
jgi:hypothetical protein